LGSGTGTGSGAGAGAGAGDGAGIGAGAGAGAGAGDGTGADSPHETTERATKIKEKTPNQERPLVNIASPFLNRLIDIFAPIVAHFLTISNYPDLPSRSFSARLNNAVMMLVGL